MTATAYTVVGVMNKMLTVTANALIWDKHASSAGIGSLLICLLAGSAYQQARTALIRLTDHLLIKLTD